MPIIIKTDHGLELTEALKNYTEKKISEASQKFGRNLQLMIDLEKVSSHHTHGEIYKAEARVSGDLNFMVSELKNNLYAAIDGLKDKLEYEISSQTKKQRSLFRNLAQNFKKFLKNKSDKKSV